MKLAYYVLLGYSFEDVAKRAATLLLGLKESFKLTQVATQGIIEGMTTLIQVSVCCWAVNYPGQLM